LRWGLWLGVYAYEAIAWFNSIKGGRSGWQVGRLAGWQVGRLAGWQVGRLAAKSCENWFLIIQVIAWFDSIKGVHGGTLPLS